jgi:hypothetical protein
MHAPQFSHIMLRVTLPLICHTKGYSIWISQLLFQMTKLCLLIDSDLPIDNYIGTIFKSITESGDESGTSVCFAVMVNSERDISLESLQK